MQRLLLASLNGLAGLLLLQQLPLDAVRTYREALATSECGTFLMLRLGCQAAKVRRVAMSRPGDRVIDAVRLLAIDCSIWAHCPCCAVERNSAHIRADKLQQLHTLHNLADLLGPDGRQVFEPYRSWVGCTAGARCMCFAQALAAALFVAAAAANQ